MRRYFTLLISVSKQNRVKHDLFRLDERSIVQSTTVKKKLPKDLDLWTNEKQESCIMKESNISDIIVKLTFVVW